MKLSRRDEQTTMIMMFSLYDSLLILFILVFFNHDSVIFCQTDGHQYTSTDHEAWEPLCKLSGVKPFDEKPIPDCNCHVYSVDQAVNSFISPLLSNLTERSDFFICLLTVNLPIFFKTEEHFSATFISIWRNLVLSGLKMGSA